MSNSWENNEVDLHGYSANEATSIIMNELFSLNNSYEESKVFITGVGQNVLSTILLNILDEEGYRYEQINSGSYKVYSKK